MMLFGRTIRICHKYTFKILTIKFIGMSYCFGNSEYDKRNGTLRNVIPYMARVKQYGKHVHMTTPQIGCRLVLERHVTRRYSQGWRLNPLE